MYAILSLRNLRMFQLPALRLSAPQQLHSGTSRNMIEDERRPSVNADFPFNSGPIKTAPQFLSARQQHQTAELDPMQTDENDLPAAINTTAAAAATPTAAASTAACEETGLEPTNRKKRMMCVDTSPSLPPPPPPTVATMQQLNPFSPAAVAVPSEATTTLGGGGGVGARDAETAKTAVTRINTSTSTSTIASTKAQKLPCGHDEEGRQTSANIDLSISCLEGSTMNIPLSGKTVPFRVVKRRGMGISSVVFECEREQASPPAVVAGGGGELGDHGPRVVTIKVMSGGESGMGAALREVETLAFLKVKREQAGLPHARFAELASWFYRRSAIGGVDHVCLVFRGGGVSLREAISKRLPPRSAGAMGRSAPPLVWEARELVEVARGLLEGIAFLHSVGLVHADIKPENVALYPPAPAPAPLPSATQASSNSDPLPTASGQLSGGGVRGGVGVRGRVGVGGGVGTGVRGGVGVVGGVGGGGGSRASAAASALPFDLRLIDLGNAVFAADAVPGVTAGTPSYLSPEAREGRAWGPAVDVWAIGCILHEVVTGDRVRAAAGSGSGSVYGGGGSCGVGGGGGRGGFGVSGDSRSLGSGAGAGVAAGVESAVVSGVVALVKRLLAEDVNARPSAQEALKDVVFLRG